MNIVERAKNICLTPKTEWSVIATEPSETGTLITGYVLPLAAIGAVAGFIGGSMIGYTIPFLGTYRTPLTSGLVLAVFGLCMAVVSIFILSFIINALAPTFGGEQNFNQAMKIAVFSYTPAWVAGALRILPALGVLAILGALYGLYLLYLGLPRLMKCPEDKAVGYTVVVVICAVVLGLIVTAVGGVIVGTAAVTSSAMTGALGGNGGGIFGNTTAGRPGSPGSPVKYDPNSALGKLQQLGDKLDESNKKMEAAQKAGDAQGAAAAAMQGLGTLLGGGNHVESVPIDQLKPFVPETFGGLSRKSSNVEKNGIAGLMVTKASATFSDAGKNINLEITDTGGISGITALAGWAGMQQEKDNEYESERTRKVDGRLVHEKVSKRGGTNEYGVILGDRFVVGASGNVGLDALQAAVGGLNLAKLESMKDAGKDAAASSK